MHFIGFIERIDLLRRIQKFFPMSQLILPDVPLHEVLHFQVGQKFLEAEVWL